MSRKSLQGNLKQEISQARANLDLVLQSITDQTGLAPEEDVKGNILISDSIDGSPRKKSGSAAGKKRKRGAWEQADSQPSLNTPKYVAKLFDRSVDLVDFGDGAPLYPICRSWIRNSASEHAIEQPAKRESSPSSLYLPPPEIHPNEKPLYTLRIPSPIEHHSQITDADNPDNGPQLLLEHLAHWKKVRESWKVAGHRYEARFSRSRALLKNLHDPGK